MITALWERTKSSSTDSIYSFQNLLDKALDKVFTAKATTACEISQAVALFGTRNTCVSGRVSPSAHPPPEGGLVVPKKALVIRGLPRMKESSEARASVLLPRMELIGV